jgi:RNA polymerase sigma factor (sigma-70 family)
VTQANGVEDLLRELAPQVLGTLARRYGDFAAAEDAVQEALLEAALRWPESMPDNPRGWLVQVAVRRMTDQWRSDSARRRREEAFAADDIPDVTDRDDSLALLLLCCHPALTPSSAIALTLRAVGGLTTAEIASAFLVPETTMAQRISRAKAGIRATGARFELPATDLQERLRSVLHVLYLVFNEGYASSGDAVHRVELSAEAIRLTRQVHVLLPDDPEVTGLLALMLLTDARRHARTGPSGELVPLEEQDRSRWDRTQIEEGLALVEQALAQGAAGEYQLQAAVAALHDEARTPEETDWPQILALYTLLERMTGNPMVSLSRAVAVAMVDGPAAGLALLDDLEPRLPGHHRLFAVRGHLLERAGDSAAAAACFKEAATRTTSRPERDYLLLKATRHQPRECHSGNEGRSLPRVVSAPWPG